MHRIRAVSATMFGNWSSPRHVTRPPTASTGGISHSADSGQTPITSSTDDLNVQIAMAQLEQAPLPQPPKTIRPSLSKYLEGLTGVDHPAVTTPGGILVHPAQSSTYKEAQEIIYAGHTKGPFSFLRMLLGRKGMGAAWFLSKILPQLVVGIIITLLVDLLDLKNTVWWEQRADTQRLHAFVGSVLAFILVFRSNGAYDRYYEGRKCLGQIVNQARELTLEVFSMQAKDDIEEVHRYRAEILRKLHIMLAFIRQNVRESHVGFLPSSTEKNTDFYKENNYVRDPTRPRLSDLLTPAEVHAYGKVQVSSRAVCVASEIKGIVQLLSKHVEYSLSLYSKVSTCLQVMLDGQETLYRIISTPVPFPYTYILNMMLLIFVYSVPFLYDCSSGGSYFGVMVLVFAYFGSQEIAVQCENPLEWDACDLSVEIFSMWINDEAADLAKFTHGKNHDFIPAHIRA